MSKTQMFCSVLVLAASVWLTRFLPFFLFKDTKKLPLMMDYLGKVLPAAMMGLLVVYCVKDNHWLNATEMFPLGVSVLTVLLLHWFKQNTVLSIAGGTVMYMVLLRLFAA